MTKVNFQSLRYGCESKHKGCMYPTSFTMGEIILNWDFIWDFPSYRYWHNLGEIDRNLADCGVNTWIYDLNTFVLLTLSGPPVTLPPWPPFQHYSHPYIVNIMTTHIFQIMLLLEKKWLVITHHSLDYGSSSLRNLTQMGKFIIPF